MTYLLNYSASDVTIASPVPGEVVVAPVVIASEGETVAIGDELTIGRWNVVVIVG